MPYFNAEDVHVDPSEFVWECTSSEKRELVDLLAEDGYIYEDLDPPEGFDALEPSTHSEEELLRLMRSMWESRTFWTSRDADRLRKEFQEKNLI